MIIFFKNHKTSITACALMAALSFGMYVVYGQTASSIGDSMHIISDLTVDGSVGIGTTSPSEKLEVQADSNDGQLRLSRSTNTNEQLLLGFNSGDYGYIQALEQGVGNRSLAVNPDGGNVGIGTTSPDAKLDVNGVINTNQLNIQNNPVLGSYYSGTTSYNYSDGEWFTLFETSEIGNARGTILAEVHLRSIDCGGSSYNIRSSFITGVYHSTNSSETHIIPSGMMGHASNSVSDIEFRTRQVGRDTDTEGIQMRVIGESVSESCPIDWKVLKIL